MTWTTTALATTSLDSTADSVATGLGQIVAAINRVNELSAHPTAKARDSMALATSALLQHQQTTYTSPLSVSGATAANRIPLDDTIPQITEGVQVTSLSFTPLSAASTLIVTVSGFALFGGTAAYDSGIAALFDGSTSAVRARWLGYVPASADHVTTIDMTYVVASGSTTARTYSLRVGPNTSTGSVAINGNTGGRLLGGAMGIVISVMELL